MEVFCEIPCLTERSSIFNGIALQKHWFKSADKRIMGQYLQKFIEYNTSLFKFIGAEPSIIGADKNTSIAFHTSHFIGAIPLRAPDTGKQIGDFVVMPRFTGRDRFEDYIEILNLLGTEISPDVRDSLPLVSGRNFRPPLYLEAVKFIRSLEELIKKPWRKFDRVEKMVAEPVGQVNWQKYIQTEYKVENKLHFPVGKNVLSEFHQEYSQIRYVFDLCKAELLSPNTPNRLKLKLKPKLWFIEERLYGHLPSKTRTIAIKESDNPILKRCKVQANKILNFSFIDSTAWRVDFSVVFEKFVQHIFGVLAKETGAKLFSNFKFNSYSERRSVWELNHLEPDAIYQKNGFIVFIDAKYKSHLYNKYQPSDLLKEEHRHDLHQILAYSSFSSGYSKHGFLCYPAKDPEIKEVKYINPINQTINKIKILGVPLKISTIDAVKRILVEALSNIERDLNIV